MEKYELQKLRDLPIEGVAERLGLRVCRHKSLCPFHDDHKPSLTFSVSRNTFRCWACGEHGGTIDLALKLLLLGGGREGAFLEACRWLADEHNVILTEYKPSETKPAKPFDSSYYERFFLRPFLNAEARRFLFEERRLDPRVVRWCRLTSWRDKQGIPWLQIPYYNKEGKLVGVQNRNLQIPSNSPLKGENKDSLPLREGRGGSSYQLVWRQDKVRNAGRGFEAAEKTVSIKPKKGIVWLRAAIKYGDNKAYFFYSLDGKNWERLGGETQQSFNLTVFVGSRFGIFCYATKQQGGYADFDWFSTEP